jgi:transposase
MKLQHIIGADLSKESIDLVCYQLQSHFKITNSTSGFGQMLRWLKQQRINYSDSMIVMEHTGLYSYHLEKFLHQHQISFTKVSALAIKRSLGLIRGKNDKVDAQRIARYGFEKRNQLQAEKPMDKGFQRLQMLHSTRERLTRHRSSLICALKEYGIILYSTDPIMNSHKKLIKELSVQIKLIEEQINQCIQTAESSISRNFKLLTGITSVGPVIATATILKTKNFTAFKDGRKFSCYCGSAPFDHSSGKSIRKKTRVSHLADKRMKTLLTLGARTAIQHDKELKEFYERRLSMGKSKNSTINIVRNKIILRMFAVINRQTPFVKQYSKAV